MLKLAWITDIHNPSPTVLGRDMNAREQADYKKTVLDGARAFADRYRADRAHLLINTGDDVDSTQDPAEDARQHAELAEILRPHIKIPGNHDIRHQGLAKAFNFIGRTQIFKHSMATMIFWHADTTPRLSKRNPNQLFKFFADTENMQQLTEALQKCDSHLPVLLFAHIALNEDSFIHPVDPDEVHHPWRSCYGNYRKLVKTLKSSDLNIFVFSGHRHYNYMFPLEGTRLTFLGMDRLTRWEDMGSKRPKGFNDARISVDKTQITVIRNGVMPAEYRFRL